MRYHYFPEFGLNSEEVVTENGRMKYWREAVPLPFFSGALWWRRFGCSCGKQFKTQAAYELHFRKAYYEEKEMILRGIDHEHVFTTAGGDADLSCEHCGLLKSEYDKSRVGYGRVRS